MKKITSNADVLAIGMDIGDKKCDLAVVGRGGIRLRSARIDTDVESLQKFFKGYKGLAVFEVSTHSPWIDSLLRDMGAETFVVNPCSAGRAIAAQGKKTDKSDPLILAQIAISTPQLLRPVKHRGREAQSHLAVVRARAALVESRSKLINTARGLVKSSGYRLPACDAHYFHRHVRDHVPEQLYMAVNPLIDEVEALSGRIRNMDLAIKGLCKEKYPETKFLTQIDGVSFLTALTFVLTLESSKRFKKSRQVGCFLGMTRRLNESGDSQPELRITKAGDRYLRQLLVSCSHYILGRRGKDSELRRFGLRLASRGTKRAKKIAVVATARKLAVLLHRLWDAEASYDPFFMANQNQKRIGA